MFLLSENDCLYIDYPTYPESARFRGFHATFTYNRTQRFDISCVLEDCLLSEANEVGVIVYFMVAECKPHLKYRFNGTIHAVLWRDKYSAILPLSTRVTFRMFLQLSFPKLFWTLWPILTGSLLINNLLMKPNCYRKKINY